MVRMSSSKATSQQSLPIRMDGDSDRFLKAAPADSKERERVREVRRRRRGDDGGDGGRTDLPYGTNSRTPARNVRGQPMPRTGVRDTSYSASKRFSTPTKRCTDRAICRVAEASTTK
jgi:hypothetical protein